MSMTMTDKIALLTELLSNYILATESLGSFEDQEDYRRVAVIAQRLIDAVASEDLEQVLTEKFAFDRQVSDCYAIQPKEYLSLAKAIEDLVR